VIIWGCRWEVTKEKTKMVTFKVIENNVDLYAEYSHLVFPGKTVIAIMPPNFPLASDFLAFDFKDNDAGRAHFKEASEIYDAATLILNEILPRDGDGDTVAGFMTVAFVAGTEDEIWAIKDKLDACYDGRERIPWWIFQGGKCIHEYT
jgi:hypothetical protein